MTTINLKKQITERISEIDDTEFLKAVFTIVTTKADETDWELTTDMKKDLEQRKIKHKEGNSKSYTWESVKKSALRKRV